MCLSSERLVMDVAADTSYSKFLEAFKVQEAKGFFSYEWVDNLSNA